MRLQPVAAKVARFHRTRNSATFRDLRELGQLVDDEVAFVRALALQTPGLASFGHLSQRNLGPFVATMRHTDALLRVSHQPAHPLLMITALDLLQSLNLLDETERIEAKRAREAGKSLLETVCAFANEPGLGGGWLLLGVVREEMALFPSYQVEGVAQPDKLCADLATQCREVFNVPVRVELSTEQVNGLAVVVAFVPEAQPQDKPIFFKAQGLSKGSMRRIGSTDQHCTEDDLAVFYQGRQRESFDAALVPDATLEDLAPEALADYRQARAENNRDAEELRWSDEELLRSLGCIAKDAGGSWRPTVAGLVLFGRAQALRRCFPMTRVDYIRVPGREWVPDPERRFDTLELRDPLFRLIRRAQAAVLDDLPKGFNLPEGELQRQDKPVIPQRVIREALVNALMHRSYRSQGPMQIIR